MSASHSRQIARPETHPTTGARPSAWRRWPKLILALALLLWGGAEGLSLFVQHSRHLSSKFTTRLQAAFGRPVEVGSYDFSLWDGPVLEAQSVTVGEDPRFGHEYFLRADSMAVRLRWQGLLRGHMEFGTLSLTRPSVNLVRNTDGEWNLSEWLPRPAAAPSSGASHTPVEALRFRRIEVDGGRINFKSGDEKLPFALVGVAGTVETDTPGTWRINLDVTPWRAAVLIQDAGTIRVSGHVGGTSSRLRPAELDFSWSGASLADVLRLARGDDYGIRGQFGLQLSARTQEQADGWTIQARSELRQIHRWDLALRPDNPALNLAAHIGWRPNEPYVEVTDARLEAPHSNARASGRFAWSGAKASKSGSSAAVQVDVSSAQIDLGDLLSWLRAFQPGVADTLSVRGLADVHGVFTGWPLRLEDATISSEAVDISDPRLPQQAHLSSLRLQYSNRAFSALPVTLTWRNAGIAPGNPPQSAFRIEALPPQDGRGVLPSWHVTGSTSQIRNLIATAGVFGWNISRGWDVSGPFACDLRFSDAFRPWQAHPIGWMEVGAATPDAGGASLGAPFLNRPIEEIKARVEMKEVSRTITLKSAQAFGARWAGTIERGASDPGWRFALSADRLTAADVDRELNPRWRETFLGRMLPFLNSRSVASTGPENLRASGRVTIGQFTLDPVSVTRLQGNLKIDGRHIELTSATGQFYGGTLSGSLDAQLDATPTYDVRLKFSRVDTSALSSNWPGLAGLFGGTGSSEASFRAKGASRDDLMKSLMCQGSASVSALELRKISLTDSLRGGRTLPGMSAFSQATASFACGQNRIQLSDVFLSGENDTIAGSGSVGLDRNLDLRLQILPRGATPPAAVASPAIKAPSYQLTGSVASPVISRVPASVRRIR